jgi:hypothetical protein
MPAELLGQRRVLAQAAIPTSIAYTRLPAVVNYALFVAISDVLTIRSFAQFALAQPKSAVQEQLRLKTAQVPIGRDVPPPPSALSQVLRQAALPVLTPSQQTIARLFPSGPDNPPLTSAAQVVLRQLMNRVAEVTRLPVPSSALFPSVEPPVPPPPPAAPVPALDPRTIAYGDNHLIRGQNNLIMSIIMAALESGVLE